MSDKVPIVSPSKCHNKIYIYIYMKPEDIVIYLSCGIYDNVFRSTRVILLGQTHQMATINLSMSTFTLLIYYLSINK